MATLDMKHIRPLQAELAGHSIYRSLRTLEDLRVFMTHHVFAVWDFMSLVKYLQRHITPLEIPWMPCGDPRLRCLINRLALASDLVPLPTRYFSEEEHREAREGKRRAECAPPRP